MADKADDPAQSGDNRPALSLHVPEPKFRPGDKADFSEIDISEPGAQPRPDESAKPEEMRDLAFGLVRVLGDDNKAHGPWGIRSLIQKLCAQCLAIWLWFAPLTSGCFVGNGKARPAST